MQHITLTPNATLGLFIAHRAYDPKGGPAIRAQADADRIFFNEAGVALLRPKGETGVEVVEKDSHEVALENHVYEHLQKALSAAAEAGTVFGFSTKERPRHPHVWFTAAEDALEKAERKDAPVKPALVEKDEKKASKKLA